MTDTTGLSHVGLEQHVCVVCGEHYDTGAVLLDTRLRNTIPRHACTGHGVCPTHQKQNDEGFVHFVEFVDPPAHCKDRMSDGEFLKSPRTGRIMTIRKEVALMFIAGRDDLPPIVACEVGTIDLLEARFNEALLEQEAERQGGEG